MNEVKIIQRIAADVSKLEAAGFEVYQPCSISEVPALFQQTGRLQQSEMLSLARNDFTDSNALFLFLKSGGRAVAGCRTKLVDLQHESFESHQRRTVPQWYGLSEDPIEKIAPPLNDLIKGKHIYCGELEFLKEVKRGKGIKITAAFARVALATSLLKWPDVNCAYCILPEHHRGLAVHYGFNTITRKAFKWKGVPPGGRLHDWLVAVSSRDQLLHDLSDGYWGQTPRESKSAQSHLEEIPVQSFDNTCQ